MTSSSSIAACKHLVLDAGPLLSLSPLRGLAENYYTVPQVLDELKDKRAREHFEKLGLVAGVSIQVQGPDAASLTHVIRFAKKTGDYPVLSHADLCVLALTYSLEVREKAKENAPVAGNTDGVTPQDPVPEKPPATREADCTPDSTEQPDVSEPLSDKGNAVHEVADDPSANETLEEEAEEEEAEREPLDVELHQSDDSANVQEQLDNFTMTINASAATFDACSPDQEALFTSRQQAASSLYDDPSDSDDGEGEWITPSNVALHKSRALDLLPSAANGKGKGKLETIPVACMTADFAMQNVLLQMELGLVGVEGRRVDRVKSWVLRCHACFKICKDSSRKFCPSCGNPTLLRTSVTISSPNATADTPTMQVHLKKNFQYKIRGTIYSIPSPKPGSAKTGSGEGLVLREDQSAWMRAKKRADGKREREERRLLTAASRGAAVGEGGAVLGSWMDPDWVPEIMSTGAGGKGRSMKSRGMDGDMPVIGHGKKNPNERRRK